MRELQLNATQRRALEGLLARPSASAGHARRARIVLLSADGRNGTRDRRASWDLGDPRLADSPALRRGRCRWARPQPKAGRKDHAVAQEKVERIIQTTLSPPPPGRSRWTTRLLARKFNLTSATVSKILRANGLKPHLVRTYKVSRDPAFASKVKDVVGLYLKPPENAIVLSVDEKTSIQALERSQLPLPLRQGRAARHTHDYKRHGVLDLYAALNIATGEVAHACTDSHTAADFLSFMKLVARQNPRRELHVVLDNSSRTAHPR